MSRLKLIFPPVQIRISDIWPAKFNLTKFCFFIYLDLQKLEREARICRLLKHANIGWYINRIFFLRTSVKEIQRLEKKQLYVLNKSLKPVGYMFISPSLTGGQ